MKIHETSSFIGSYRMLLRACEIAVCTKHLLALDQIGGEQSSTLKDAKEAEQKKFLGFLPWKGKFVIKYTN